MSGYTVNGAYAEYALAEAAFVGHVPQGLDPLDAAPLTCAGVTTYKAIKVSGARSSDLVAIFGVGGLGHLAVQYARIAGASVAAVDLVDIDGAQLRASTIESYRRNIRKHVLPSLGHLKLQSLSAQHLNGLYRKLEKSGRLDGSHLGEALSPRTVRYVHTIIRRALKDAVKQKLVVRNVALDADPPTDSQDGKRISARNVHAVSIRVGSLSRLHER
jgi:hypothetical protein